jgi:hypothetical protein
LDVCVFFGPEPGITSYTLFFWADALKEAINKKAVKKPMLFLVKCNTGFIMSLSYKGNFFAKRILK